MELDKKYTLNIDEGLVSNLGKGAIADYLRDNNLPTTVLLSQQWCWNWVVQHGASRGKLPKRLARTLNDRHGIKITSEQTSEIGNIARAHILPSNEYTFDFTDNFNWEAGDFGDPGSCFWGSNYLAKEVLRNHGALAIRLYDALGYTGTSRAWLYQLSNNGWLLFNSYGDTTSKMANLFANFLSNERNELWEYKGIHLEINSEDGGLVFLNSSPQIVFAASMDVPDSIDLDWNLDEYRVCDCCDGWETVDSLTVYRNDNYCEICLDEYAVRCSECDKLIQSMSEEWTRNGHTVCSNCYDEQ